MNSVLKALQKALVAILNPAIFLRTLAPGIIAVVFWVILMWTSWSTWVSGLSDMLLNTLFIEWLSKLLALVVFVEPISVALWSARVILFFAAFPMMFLTALALTSFLLLPILLQRIHQAHYSELKKEKGGSQLTSVTNGLKASAVYFGFLVITLPLFLIPGMQLLIPLLLNAYLARMILGYDILMDYATAQEIETILQQQRFNLQALGFLTAFLFYLPLLNFIAPALTAMAFIFFLFEELKKLRGV